MRRARSAFLSSLTLHITHLDHYTPHRRCSPGLVAGNYLRVTFARPWAPVDSENIPPCHSGRSILGAAHFAVDCCELPLRQPSGLASIHSSAQTDSRDTFLRDAPASCFSTVLSVRRGVKGTFSLFLLTLFLSVCYIMTIHKGASARGATSRASSVARTIAKRRDKPYKTEQSRILAKKRKLTLNVGRVLHAEWDSY